MRRSLVIAALLAPHLAAAAPRVASRETADAPRRDGLGMLTLTFAHLAADFELPVPHALIDGVLRWQLEVRDLVHGAANRLTAWAAKASPLIPDLTVLRIEPVANTESSGFGWRDDPIRKRDRRFHSGADFRADPGTPVVAAGDGVVVFAGRQGGYGNVIYVNHGGGVVTRYAHLRRIETKQDAPVTAGERIGQVGSTGRATGPHLHFEVRLDGRAVDPVTAMTVAELERGSPGAGQLAAFALVPELQEHILNKEDQGSGRHEARPERRGRAKRQQVLW